MSIARKPHIPGPPVIILREHQKEANDRGEFVDIHDGGIVPADYDVLITDISHQTLETIIAEELGIPYLSKATGSDAHGVVKVGQGYIHGDTQSHSWFHVEMKLDGIFSSWTRALRSRTSLLRWMLLLPALIKLLASLD